MRFMNKTPATDNPHANLVESKWKTAIVVAITVAALGYLFLRPILNQQFGWKLPDIFAADNQVAENDKKDGDNELVKKSSGAQDKTHSKSKSDRGSSETSAGKSLEKNASSKTVESKSKPSSPNAKSNAPRGPPKSGVFNTGGAKSNNSKTTAEPELGQLTKAPSGELRSTAGLIYGRGSRDGTRLKHVMRHAEDDLSKPIHGVFDGKQDEILALIDQAYLMAKKGSNNVTSSKQRDRTVYTIYFSKRIGYVGGQKGKQKKNPICKELSLVLEGDRVITAYPK